MILTTITASSATDKQPTVKAHIARVTALNGYYNIYAWNVYVYAKGKHGSLMCTHWKCVRIWTLYGWWFSILDWKMILVVFGITHMYTFWFDFCLSAASPLGIPVFLVNVFQCKSFSLYDHIDVKKLVSFCTNVWRKKTFLVNGWASDGWYK